MSAEMACCGPYVPPCCRAPEVLDGHVRRGAVHVQSHLCDNCGATGLALFQVHEARGLHHRGPYPFPPVTIVPALVR